MTPRVLASLPWLASVAIPLLALAACSTEEAGEEDAAAGAGGTWGTGGGPGSSTGGADSGGAPAQGSGTLRLLLDTSASGADVADAVTQYPLAVALDGTNFDFSQAGATGGDDLRFERNGQPLPYEVELWDPVAGRALVWVLVDEILGDTAGQEITLQVGAAEPSLGEVFSTEAGFYGVWHLDEDGNTTADGYADSSTHGGHATGVGLSPGSSIPARLGQGTRLENPTGQNTARFLRVSGQKAEAYNPDGPLTVSIWALAKSYPLYSYETILSKGDTSWSLQRVTYEPDTGYQACLLAGSGETYHFCTYEFSEQPLVTDEWIHFTLVLDEPVVRLYTNGHLNAERTGYTWHQGDHPLGIGNQTQFDGRRQWDGILDEARVMRVARSAAWAKLDYESQKEGQTLLDFAP